MPENSKEEKAKFVQGANSVVMLEGKRHKREGTGGETGASSCTCSLASEGSDFSKPGRGEHTQNGRRSRMDA